ncbi:MAG: acireductone synthase [Cyanobacteriota bacterium]|jgi:enolase-phosphatase E1
MNPTPGIQVVLLDIEGTTCPVSFVSDVLFPYAREQMLAYLQEHHSDSSIRSLLAEVHAAWQNDFSPGAMALAKGLNPDDREASKRDGPDLLPEEAWIYLNWLIQEDRKLTALKDLQGLIWEQGYQQKKLIAPLFKDVAPALQRWHQAGIQLAVYSSGSVQAQKLLYGHTNAGDLSHLFSHWFDTRTGCKTQPESYAKIATVLKSQPEEILFISDAPAELVAARQAQMGTIFSCRPGNPHQQAEGHTRIESFAAIQLS